MLLSSSARVSCGLSLMSVAWACSIGVFIDVFIPFHCRREVLFACRNRCLCPLSKPYNTFVSWETCDLSAHVTPNKTLAAFRVMPITNMHILFCHSVYWPTGTWLNQASLRLQKKFPAMNSWYSSGADVYSSFISAKYTGPIEHSWCDHTMSKWGYRSKCVQV